MMLQFFLGHCVLQFFKLVSDTPEQSNLLENLGSQIFDDFLCSAIKDCFGHGFVVGEKNARRAREKPDLGGFGVVSHGWVWLWSGQPWLGLLWCGRPWLGLALEWSAMDGWVWGLEWSAMAGFVVVGHLIFFFL